MEKNPGLPPPVYEKKKKTRLTHRKHAGGKNWGVQKGGNVIAMVPRRG